MTGNCIQSKNHPASYGNNEACTISTYNVALTVDAFNTESRYDFLTMGGQSYSGTSGLVGEIMERFERRGMRLLCAKMMQAPESLLKEHYADLSKKGFFSELIRYMGSGPVVPMVWQGLGAVNQGRVLLGATNPK